MKFVNQNYICVIKHNNWQCLATLSSPLQQQVHQFSTNVISVEKKAVLGNLSVFSEALDAKKHSDETRHPDKVTQP